MHAVDKETLTVPVVNFIKGLALVMMVAHHCGSSFTTVADIRSYALSLSFCVSIYAFLTGWVYYHHKDKSCGYSCRKVVSIMLEYGIVVVFSMMMAYVFCGWVPTFQNILYEFLPFSDKHKLMVFAWYIGFYVALMLLLPYFPLVWHVENPVNRAVFFIAFILFAISSMKVLDSLHCMQCAIVGYMVARYRCIERISHKFKYLKTGLVGALALIILSCWLYYIGYEVIPQRTVGSVLAPVFCAGALIAHTYLRPNILKCATEFLGKHSLNVWLIHGLFFSEVTRLVFHPVACCVDSLWIVIAIVGGSSLLVSMALKPLQTITRNFVLDRLGKLS